MAEGKGKVWLVGAGTGDFGLFTLKGMQILSEAEVVVYDALVSLEILSRLPKQAEWINVGKRAGHHLVPQEQISRILLKKAQEGKKVVRLKGGDPFVFGRGGEELEVLCEHDIPFEVVPGITSSIAVAAYNGIPVTHRDYTSSFHVITGHKKDGILDIDFKSLAALDATLVFLMGVSALDTICSKLVETGMNPDTPAAILERGTTCRQKRAVATVSTLQAEARKKEIKSPAVIVIGRVCALEKAFAWFEKKPLWNKQILITRPENRASVLAERLRKYGAQVLEVPAIRTIPVCELGDGSLIKKLDGALEELKARKGRTCVAFTSPQGVEHFFAQLKLKKMDIRLLARIPELTFAVLGNGTRKALEQYGIFADYMPEKYSALELGKLLADKLDTDTKVFLFRAKEASVELTRQLENAGIDYEDAAAYQTVYEEPPAITEKIIQAFDDNEIDMVTFTSASTVRGFVHIFKDIDYTKVHAVCIGAQTAAEAEKYGMKISVADAATIDSMVALILKNTGN